MPNDLKIFQMAKNISTFSNLRPSKIYTNWYFGFETKPSGNPGWNKKQTENMAAAIEQYIINQS
jgi:hypothetical protein